MSEPGPVAAIEDNAEENISDVSTRIPALPKFRFRLPDPAGRKDIEYYRDPAHRGYLVHTVKEGEGPSLFFKPPGSAQRRAVKSQEVAKKQREVAENKLW